MVARLEPAAFTSVAAWGVIFEVLQTRGPPPLDVVGESPARPWDRRGERAGRASSLISSAMQTHRFDGLDRASELG
jgi:hypothetical protein